MLCAVANGKRTWHSLMEQCPVPVLLSQTRVGQPLHVLTLRILQQLKGSLKKKLPSSHKPMEHSACSRLRGFAELLPLRGCLMLLVCVSPGIAFPCQSASKHALWASLWAMAKTVQRESATSKRGWKERIKKLLKQLRTRQIESIEFLHFGALYKDGPRASKSDSATKSGTSL